MARGLSIARVREYFRTEEMDIIEVVLTLVQKDVAARNAAVSQPALPFHKKSRRARKNKMGIDAGIPNTQTSEVASA